VQNSLPNETQNVVQNAAQSDGRKDEQNSAVQNSAVVERVLPDVLEGARASIRGQVNVEVKVTADAAGNVANATIVSAGPSSYFAKVSLQAAQRWRFKPRQAGGQAVSSEWLLRFHFTQSGTEVIPVEVSPRG
jgi:TonB family protein